MNLFNPNIFRLICPQLVQRGVFVILFLITMLFLFHENYANENIGIQREKLYYGGDDQMTIYLYSDGFSYHFNNSESNDVNVQFCLSNLSNISIEAIRDSNN